jgi:hypothetical protein
MPYIPVSDSAVARVQATPGAEKLIPERNIPEDRIILDNSIAIVKAASQTTRWHPTRKSFVIVDNSN